MYELTPLSLHTPFLLFGAALSQREHLRFDTTGAEQLGGKLRGTKKWIGATEVAVLLRSQGVRAQIVDFSSVATPHAQDLFSW